MAGTQDQLEVSEEPLRRRLKAVGRFAFGLGLFGVVLWWLVPDWSALAGRVALEPGWIVVGLLGTTGASFVTAARWQLLAELMGGNRLRYLSYFYVLVLTRLLGQFTSTLAMDLVGRGVGLRSSGSERGLGHAATQVVLERLLDLVLPLLLLGWALVMRWELLGPDVSGAPALTLGVCSLVFLGLATLLLGPSVRVALRAYLFLRLRLGKQRRAEVEGELSDASGVALPRVEPALAAKVALYSLLRFAFVIVQFWGMGCAVGLELGWVEMTIATPFAQLAGMIGLTPGGLGMLEVGWAGGLGFVGVDGVGIGLFMLAQRVGVIAFFGLLTLVSWPLEHRERRRERKPT
jgi:uncharacterized membrane protein YbhN (UPF0104 family)